MRAGLLALTLILLSAVNASAEWQIRPFFGVSFGGDTTIIDLAGAAGSPNPVIGATGALLGDVLGVEADFGFAPGFFQTGDEQLVRGNSVTMLTGNIILSAPRHRTRYTLGPYFVVGGGLLHAHIDDTFDLLPISSTLPAIDIGGGATGFLTERIGLNWEARYFTSVGEGKVRGSSIGPQDPAEQLSFWRASMGLVIRY
jgi:hypothetical protein